MTKLKNKAFELRRYLTAIAVGLSLIVAGLVVSTQPAAARTVGTTYACQYLWGPAFQYTNFQGKRWLESTRAWVCWVV